jgi:alpha-glucosidase
MTRTAILLAAPASPPTVPLNDDAGGRNGSATIRVIALTDSILRVRVARGGRFPEDARWAVPAQVRTQSVRVEPLAN